MESKISTGSSVLDWLLEGGYEKDAITTIYGPAGSGKTNLCLLCIAHAPKGKKVLYIDTEGSFSVARFKQIVPEHKEALKHVLFFNPTEFSGQQKAFDAIRKAVDNKTGLIVVDSIAMLYRLEIGKTKDVYNVNKALGIQLGMLTEIARKKHIPILVTNQVYTEFENPNNLKMVGGDLLKYQSKCLIELQKAGDGLRKAILRKHRSIEEGKQVLFRIVDKGIEGVED